jgi:hypothetical protein
MSNATPDLAELRNAIDSIERFAPREERDEPKPDTITLPTYMNRDFTYEMKFNRDAGRWEVIPF